jgi:hypothetical protein
MPKTAWLNAKQSLLRLPTLSAPASDDQMRVIPVCFPATKGGAQDMIGERSFTEWKLQRRRTLDLT